ncbi:Alpha/Beta hydrolase protein [Aspergillus karnatakaensis]|uniref:Alpha/Beta hydrolase protein n=1 Tax=Aspergillus karnatakaensis TaxID=1810916 RepID=UPI003CCCCB59
MILKPLLGLAVLSDIALAAPSGLLTRGAQPTAHVRNGTYTGVRNTHYGQDLFLGIPYAQQPVGDWRFGLPQSLNETWEGERDAKAYGDICVGYGTDSIWYPMSEACLTLNVIRDSSVEEGSDLPVGVWIHGGGFVMGSGADERYNMSAIVANAHRIGKPFIGITINYRLSTWGFLASDEVTAAGATNLGLRDQRLALQWIQENIAAFGGDPSKVTIWGESAGGMSVGAHLIAYGGRDDGLFRGAIMQSGGSIMASSSNTTQSQLQYDEIVEKAGCSGAEDTLQCLRTVPFEELNALFNGTEGSPAYDFSPAVDGDLLREQGSIQLEKGAFVKVPIIAGTNTDEGTSFGPTGINTTAQFYNYLTNSTSSYTLPPTLASRILSLYPDDPSQGIPAFLNATRIPSKGLQWRRTSAFAGDVSMHAPRRAQCAAWADFNTPAYCYRFNTRGNDVDYLDGVAHFTEVSFVFNNVQGLGYHYGKPFGGLSREDLRKHVGLSEKVASMWAGFIHDLDPNFEEHGPKGGYWEQYETRRPVDLVLDANATGAGVLEEDSWRKEGIDFINSIAGVLLR